MKAVTPASLPNSSRRTQPTRQTRTNPPRNSAVAGRAYPSSRSLGAGPAAENGHTGVSSPGFFPAITHFADAITALPKDIIRHFTLLREVDAKLHGPEEALAEYIAVAANTPAPECRVSYSHVESVGLLPPKESGASGAVKLTTDKTISQEVVIREESPDDGDADIARRALFHHLRYTINEMLPALDEKNHVISTANEALNKQLLRLDSVYPYIKCEISEEARHGSLSHWAYIEKPGVKRNSTGPERSRRDAAATNGFSISSAINDGETVGTRSAMLARKQKVLQVDSDFEEGRAHLAAGSTRQRDNTSAQPAPATGAGKRSHGNTKAKRAAESTVGAGSVITNGPAAAAIGPPSKRRRTEKAGGGGNITGGALMEKTPSVVANGITGKGNAGSPRGGTPAAEVGRKRARGGGAAGGTSRKRNVTAPAAQSPSLASSPVHGTFAASKDIPRSSPVPGATQRPASTRVRQNSTASLVQDAPLANPRQRPSPSASSKPAQTNGVSVNTPDANNVNGRGVTEIKGNTREIVNSKGGLPIENDDSRKDGDPKDTPAAGSGANSKINRASEERPPRREELHSNSGSTHIVPQIITTTTGTRNSGKVSKTSTPTANTFPDSHRSRPSRTNDSNSATTAHPIPIPRSRSHKKGASAIHQQHMAAAAAASTGGGDEEGSSMQGDDEDDDDSEPRYCYCNQVSYGEMVACDADSCPKEWFHLDCVGLTKAPTKNAKWYCDECKDSLRKGRVGGAAR
ncbi:hypothetical protein FGG08_005951 [Glutinoglossum americanum]|uniref:Chromatin modification-related protein n=1 Tax=Glutinoglossum americanum TaxID=1670608 RepID=A0A9P8HXF0_9PEZI|nr:hypothetical protein FGG08_005951 [Glutinoglossum americanum]